MKLLITGTTGQVGFELAQNLRDKFELLTPTRDDVDLSNISVLTDYLEHNRPDMIVNCAAWTAVDKAETETEGNRILNTEVPKVLAQFAKQNDIWLIHFSTDYVYPGTGDLPWSEEDSTRPRNQYGIAKRQGEVNVQYNCDKFVILRTSWVYSYRGNNFLNAMKKLGKERESLNIVADQIGSPSSALFLAEHTELIINAILANRFAEGIYNFCPTNTCSWYEFAIKIFELLQQRGVQLNIDVSKVNPITSAEYPTPADRPLNSRMSVSKLQAALECELPDWESELVRVVERVS